MLLSLWARDPAIAFTSHSLHVSGIFAASLPRGGQSTRGLSGQHRVCSSFHTGVIPSPFKGRTCFGDKVSSRTDLEQCAWNRLSLPVLNTAVPGWMQHVTRPGAIVAECLVQLLKLATYLLCPGLDLYCVATGSVLWWSFCCRNVAYCCILSVGAVSLMSTIVLLLLTS